MLSNVSPPSSPPLSDPPVRCRDGSVSFALIGGTAHTGEGPAAVEATVILPAYNEAAALPAVLNALTAVLDPCVEIIVVDDASTDDTAAIAHTFRCRLLRHTCNQGKGGAVRTGLRAGRGRFIIVMDADNTYPAEAVPHMLALATEYDFVRCIRQHEPDSMPGINSLGNTLFDTILRLVHGLDGADHLTGMYGLRRSALDALDLTAARFDLEVEIGIKARAQGLRTATVPISYGARLGEKKLRAWRDGWHILWRILALTLLYRPGVAFGAPAVLLWALTLFAAALLTPSVGGASSPSLLVLALGLTAGLQCLSCGLAAALYGTERGVPMGQWVRAARHPRVRQGAAWLGLLLVGAGVALRGVNAGDPWAAVLAAALVATGAQVIVVLLFLSLFAGAQERSARVMTVQGWGVVVESGPEPQPIRDGVAPAIAGLRSDDGLHP